jgi:hypothetical protein
MALDALAGRAQAAPPPPAGIFSATVSRLAADGPLVALDADAGGGAYGPCRGSLTVAAGDQVLVAFDDAGTPWIVATD